MKTAAEMFEDFKTLASEERTVLFQLIRNALYPNAEVPLETIMQELRDARFSKGFICPHCESKSVKRHGFYDGRQRYKCKDCNKTFSDTTNTVITGTHYPDKWLAYVECMLQGMSLRKIAEQLKIHVSTAFFWRHKILLALMREPSESLKGIIEADETYMLESLKGKNRVKKLGTRKARNRGGVSQFRGISREQVCILVAVDRNGEIVSQVAGYGRISSMEIEGVIGDYLKDATCICTDAGKNFITYAKEKELEHYVLNARKGERVKGIYHIQHVNNYHKRWKDWMAKFQGVATKYLNHYLEYFRYLERFKSMGAKRMKQDMLVRAFVHSNHCSVEYLRTI